MNRDLLTENLKRKIYEYDDTYKIMYNNVLKELIENIQLNYDKKIKKKIVKVLLNEWKTNQCGDWPKVNMFMIINSMKDGIVDVMGKKNIKLILQSFCYYNNRNNYSYMDNFNYHLHLLGLNDDDDDSNTINTVKTQISDFLKSVIDESKLEQYLYGFIEDKNMLHINYLLHDKYIDITDAMTENANITNVFRNNNYENQIHLFNVDTAFNDLLYKNKWIDETKSAIKLYNTCIGKVKKTIQIRRCGIGTFYIYNNI